ncbi:hypothetical protein QN366_04725 [Pseudomonas sp. CCC3.2]|uniref:hypothetical protein n=1 Tax=unclassified Pseudomonas TaxID=196821 RepID=UPI002AB47EA1|nr:MULTISPECIES: hypothetical protein [unclassified Pseudomonas]MDY7559983.1 hypothetical protein [Pseudomonas sp. AB6]MEB0179377.1 hypothetical protein [Pseudomonas sp. CCC3.2]MEB0210443.1 hypothetical protein [Pseudomonas sp. AB6]
MDADDEFGCLGIPTPAEMWKQHATLLAAELEEMTLENRKARQNIAKLVEMHGQAAAERDRLKSELKLSTQQLSSCNLECSNLGNEINGLTISSNQAKLFFKQKCDAEKALFELRKQIGQNI